MPALSRRDRALLLLIVLLGVAACNARFADGCRPERITAMNDVPGILAGFRAAPNLLVDGLSWWHGPWIQQGIGAFRPISSYLLWIDCWIGTHWGFLYTAFVGVALLIVDCLLCVALSWRFTRSRIGAATAALLAPAATWFVWSGLMPDDWLAWFPVHHDLMMIGWLLGALLAFDIWLETARTKPLVITWICFVLGVWSKEFLYIFPLMALALTVGRRFETGISRATAGRQIALMIVFVALMAAYRYAVLPDAYNPPPLKMVHMIKRPWLYWFGPFYIFVLSEDIWFVGVAALWFVLAGTIIRCKQSARGAWMARPFAGFGVALGVLMMTALYMVAVGYDLATLFWYLFDEVVIATRLSQMVQMIATIYAVFLLFKYRRQSPALSALALMMLAYIPVWTYLGWHYTLAGWFVRCAVYWPLVAHLAARDLSGHWHGWRNRRDSSPMAAPLDAAAS